MPEDKVQITYTLNDQVSGKAKEISASLSGIEKQSAGAGKGLSGVDIGQKAVSKTGLLTSGILLGVAAALYKVGQASLNASIEYEQQVVAFEAMLGSAKRASDVLADITELSAKTPFEKKELIEYTKQLYAMGVEEQKLVSTMRTLGDVAAGVGKDKLPQIVYAFGQVQVAGRLMTNDIRQFTDAGVPLLDVLSKQFGVTKNEIRKMAEEGKISSKDVEAAFQTMTASGGKFFDMMEKQAGTTGGKISNFKDSLNEAAIIIGNFFKPALDLALDGLIYALNAFISLSRQIGVLKNGFNDLSQSVLIKLQEALLGVLKLVDKVGGAFLFLPKMIKGAFVKNHGKVDISLGIDTDSLSKSIQAQKDALLKMQSDREKSALQEADKARRLREQERAEKEKEARMNAQQKQKEESEASRKEEEKFQKERESRQRKAEQLAKDAYEQQMLIDEPLLKAYYENEEKKYQAKLDMDQKMRDREATQNKYFLDAFAALGQGQLNLQEAISQGLLQFYIKEKLAELDVLAAGMFQSGMAKLMGSMFTNPMGYAEIAASAALVAGSRAALSQIKLAKGGIVMPQAGGIQATIGEAGKPEAVIPLDDKRSQQMLGGGGGGNSVIILDSDGMTMLAKGVYKRQTDLLKTGELSPRK